MSELMIEWVQRRHGSDALHCVAAALRHSVEEPKTGPTAGRGWASLDPDPDRG